MVEVICDGGSTISVGWWRSVREIVIVRRWVIKSLRVLPSLLQYKVGEMGSLT